MSHTPTPIAPALTPAEWAEREAYRGDETSGARIGYFGMSRDALCIAPEYGGAAAIDLPNQRHALAALALHGQPFGFTREDVALLRALAAPLLDLTDDEYTDYALETTLDSAEVTRLRNLATRLAALLPPEP